MKSRSNETNKKWNNKILDEVIDLPVEIIHELSPNEQSIISQ